MNFRLVEKAAVPSNPTRDDFAAYLSEETGGTVFLDAGPIEHFSATHWKIPAYSLDGHTSSAFEINPLSMDELRKLAIDILGDSSFGTRSSDTEGSWTPGVATGRGFTKTTTDAEQRIEDNYNGGGK